MWYVTHGGRQTPLHVTDRYDEAAANAAHARLVEELAAGVAARLAPQLAPPPPPPGTGPGTIRPAAAEPSRTVAEAVAAFMREADGRVDRGKLEPRSRDGYRLHLSHLTAAFGTRQLAELAPRELEEWADRPAWSASYQHDVLGTVLQLLRANGVVRKLRRPAKESRGADTCLTDEQFARVTEECYRQRSNGDLVPLLQTLRETGARPQEVAQVTPEGVDWENSLIRRRKHKTKRATGADRIIHLNAAAVAALTAQRTKYRGGLLFRTCRGKAWNSNEITRRLRIVSERVGFRVIAYGLGRHSFATRLLVAGVPDALVAGLLGQVGTTMLSRHYNHVGQQARAMKAAAELASRPPDAQTNGHCSV